MALATQCPYCHTTFRVAHDQLKLRAGLVRCGACKEIFNGVEHLLPLDEIAQIARPPVEDFPDQPAEPTEFVEPAEPPIELILEPAIEPAIDELVNEPAIDEPAVEMPQEEEVLEPAATEDEEPGFVIQERRRQKFSRIASILMIAGVCILTPVLLIHSAYVFRSQIAVRLPQTRPALVKICAAIGCSIDLPAQRDAISIESSDLERPVALPDTLVLTVLLRNQGSIPQAWPHIELILKDANEKAIARRAFAPREYLPASQHIAKGFAAASEQPVKLTLELTQLNPEGYRLNLFYP